jgi:hypothetical protein
MLLRLFRGTGPGVVLLILFTSVAVWLSAFINPHLPSSFHYDINPMPLYSLLKEGIGNNALAGVIFSFVLVVLLSFILVNFNTSVFFINERTFLPAAIFILLSGLFPHYQVLNPVLPASVFLMIAVRRIIDAYRKSGTAFNFFDASLLISTGSLFYANLIWFGLLVIIGIAILRTGNIKELAISILGLCTPIFLTIGLYYITGKDLNSLMSDIHYNLFDKTGEYYLSRLAIAGLIIIGLNVLISIIHLISVMNSKKIKSRKTFTELLWTFMISIVVFFVLPSVSVEIVWLISIPVSYFLSHYFIFSKKKLIPEIFFAALFIIIAALQIWYIK